MYKWRAEYVTVEEQALKEIEIAAEALSKLDPESRAAKALDEWIEKRTKAIGSVSCETGKIGEQK